MDEHLCRRTSNRWAGGWSGWRDERNDRWKDGWVRRVDKEWIDRWEDG